MKEQISALVDGELDPSDAGRCLSRVSTDDLMRDTWEAYHLIGDALRGDLGPGYAAKVVLRIADEPTVLAPRRHRPLAPRLVRAALPVAASAAAVAFVAWMALPQLWQDAPAVALAPAAVVPAVAPAAVGIGDYLLAHQRFSPSGAMQGVASYVRTVAIEAGK